MKKRITVARVASKLGYPRKTDKNQVELSNGTCIRLTFFAPEFYLDLLRDAMERWPEPEVPVIHIENAFDGAKDEPNPNDPEYLAKVNEARNKQANYMTDALLMLGVECEVPAQWKRRMEKLNKVLPKDPDDLKIYYLRNFVLTVEEDYSRVLLSLQRRVVVTEQGVAEAAARFKSDIPESTDHSVPAEGIGDSGGSGVGDG